MKKSVFLKDISLRFYFSKRHQKSFYALKNISLEVERGELLGLVGKNGAGKSSLLKIISGIYPPTQGIVKVEGKIAPLIELGGSFIPNLSGYDNIFFSGSLFGFSKKEILSKVDKIIEFSGIGEFIDLPVKDYSSGMYARLAFSTMLFFEPDVVLIDEVFAVGDEDFQKKSMNKIFEFKQEGKTIVIASHNLNLIGSFCDRLMVLDKGRNLFLGDVSEGISRYLNLFQEKNTGKETDSKRWGNREIEILEYEIINREGKRKRIFNTHEYFEIRVKILKKNEKIPIFGLAIKSDNGFLISGPNNKFPSLKDFKGEKWLSFIVNDLVLNAGKYSVDIAFYEEDLITPFDHIQDALSFLVKKGSNRNMGFIDVSVDWKINE